MRRIKLVFSLIVLFFVSQNAFARLDEPIYPRKLNNYRIVNSTTAIPSAVGISGVAWNPYTNTAELVDNNNIHYYEIRPDQPTTLVRDMTLSGFTDPEGMTFMTYNPATNTSTYAFSEEGLNRVTVCDQAESTGSTGTLTRGSCTSSRVMQTSGAADIWTPDVTNGMEGLTYNTDTNQFYVCKQKSSLEFFVCDNSASPACTEPFDAQTVLSGTVASCNDLHYDRKTKTVLWVSDDSNMVIRINPATGAIIDSRSITDLGFTQEEGVCMTPDTNDLFVSSEGTSFAHLKYMTPGGTSPYTSTSAVITQTTADDQTQLDKGADASSLPLRIINDVNGFGDSDIDATTKTKLSLEFYDSNELKVTQTIGSRLGIYAVTPVGATSVQQESGGEGEFSTTLGSGTHGTNSEVFNLHLFNTGQVGVQQGAASTSVGAVWAKVGGTIYQSTTQTGNTANTETNLFSRAIEAATLNTNGDSLSFYAAGTVAGTAAVDKQVKVVYGATTIIDTGSLAITAAEDWSLRGNIVRTGAATQKATVTFSISGSILTTTVTDYTTPAETLANAITLKVTGKGTNASDVVGEFFKVAFEPTS